MGFFLIDKGLLDFKELRTPFLTVDPLSSGPLSQGDKCKVSEQIGKM